MEAETAFEKRWGRKNSAVVDVECFVERTVYAKKTSDFGTLVADHLEEADLEIENFNF